MPEIIDQLADLTSLRDRDNLDASLAQAMRDLLQPESIAVHRVIGDAGDLRWLTRTRLAKGDLAATTDAAWSDPAALPVLPSRPDWQRCVDQSQVLCLQEGEQRWITLLPMADEVGSPGVVELVTDSPLTDTLMRLVTGVLRIYRNVQALLDDSERDTLTGLLNRKSFDDTFYKLASPQPHPGAAGDLPDRGARRAQASASYWLGVIDIDHFKQVNDRFGHLIGDEVLLLLSRVMRACFRFHDRLYRFGGEEFVVLLRCASQADAAKALERFREAVRRYPFPQVETITVSIGYTQVRGGDTPSAAVERADKAVYQAKHLGRDRVCHHADLLAQGLLDADPQERGDVELF